MVAMCTIAPPPVWRRAGNGVAAGVDHGLEVDGHHPVPQREVDLGRGLVLAEEQHAGRVDQVVQTATTGAGVVDGPAHQRFVGEIALHVGGPRSAGHRESRGKA